MLLPSNQVPIVGTQAELILVNAAGCKTGEFWAVSQAAPMRRVHINGLTTLMDYCTSPSFASGGFIADSEFDDSTVINGSQQQWLY